jgi:peptide/nickel transport system substrate-binding protein
MSTRSLTRREFLKLGAGTAFAVGLSSACTVPSAPQSTQAPAAALPTPTEVTAPAAAKQGGSLIFATSVDAPNLDPQMEISDARMRRSHLMYDTLVEWGDDFSIQPGLAESWDTTGTTWTFHLRQGVQFSNGKELDADDVLYSMQRVLDSPGAGFYNSIQGMKAVDQHTVELELSQASAPLLAALGGRYAFILPKGTAEEVDLKQNAVGSGAFTVAEFSQNQRLVLKKNPNYWNANMVHLDELTIQIIPDEANIVPALRSGDVHLTIFEDAKNYLLTKDEPDLVTERWSAARWDVLDFPLDVEPFSNVKFRQAIASALDREAIMQAAIGGLGVLLYVLPPAMWPYIPPEQGPFFKRDVERAKQLLAEAGYPDGMDLTLTSIVSYAALGAAAQVIAENLKDIGLNVEIQQQELGIWIDAFLAGTFDTFTMNSWGGWIDPDMPFYNHFHRPPEGKDFRGWNNAEISDLLDKGRYTVDRAEREQIYTEIQALIAEQVPLIPLYSADIVTARQDTVQNFRQHPSGYYHNLRWISLEAKA